MEKPKLPMSIREYAVINKGERCPVCRSDRLTGDELEHNGHVIVQGTTCRACGAMWIDLYMLEAYQDLDTEGVKTFDPDFELERE